MADAFIDAETVVMPLAASVVTAGGAAVVVNEPTAPKPVPAAFEAMAQ